MKVYIIIENFEKENQYSSSSCGYVNSVFSDKEKAIRTAERLMEGEENYTCKVIEREMF